MSNFLQLEVDATLLQRARSGERAAHAELFARFGPAVLTLGRRMLGSVEQAEEVLQDTFMEVLTKLESFRGEAPFGGWLRRIAVNKCLERLRRRKRALPQWLLLERDGATTPEPGLALDLERALDVLPPLSRAVLWLHDVEGYTHREIAGLLGRTPSFSKSRLARAHGSLRALLEPAETGTEEAIGHACQP